MRCKFKNPYFWLSTIAVIFSADGIDINTLTSWNLLFNAILSILNNPVLIIAVVVALLGIWNDNGTPGLDVPVNKIQNK